MKLATSLFATVVATPAFAHHETMTSSQSTSSLLLIGCVVFTLTACVIAAPLLKRDKVSAGK